MEGRSPHHSTNTTKRTWCPSCCSPHCIMCSMSKWFRCKPNKGLKHTNQELTLKHGLIHRMSPNYSRSIACSLVWVKLSSHTVTMIHNQPIARCLYHYNAAQYSTMLYHTDECGYYYYLVRLLLSLTVINCERVQIALNKCKESA